MVVCVSHHSARVLAERGYFNSTINVRVVHNGSPMEGIERVERAAGVTDGADGAATKGADGGLATRSGGETPETRSILCVARLDEHKGIDVLFRALARLGDLPVRLDLVGAGKAEGALREEAERLGLAPRIHWHGYATRDGVRDFLGRAELLVLPSRSENFPLVILEALHAGLAIVATTVGGIPEAVRDGKEALLVPPEDAEALAGALRRVILDDGLRRKLAAAAGERAAEFTWDRAAERMERIYLELRG